MTNHVGCCSLIKLEGSRHLTYQRHYIPGLHWVILLRTEWQLSVDSNRTYVAFMKYWYSVNTSFQLVKRRLRQTWRLSEHFDIKKCDSTNQVSHCQLSVTVLTLVMIKVLICTSGNFISRAGKKHVDMKAFDFCVKLWFPRVCRWIAGCLFVQEVLLSPSEILKEGFEGFWGAVRFSEERSGFSRPSLAAVCQIFKASHTLIEPKQVFHSHLISIGLLRYIYISTDSFFYFSNLSHVPASLCLMIVLFLLSTASAKCNHFNS